MTRVMHTTSEGTDSNVISFREGDYVTSLSVIIGTMLTKQDHQNPMQHTFVDSVF